MGAGDDETVQPFQRGDFDVAVVEPECELVNVAVKVFRTRVVIDAMQPALHDSPNALYAVRGDVSAHVFARAMVDRLAVEKQSVQAVISRRVVGMKRGTGFDVGMDSAMQGCRINVRDMHSDGAPATLTHSEDGGLSHSAAPLVQPLADVFIPLLAANIGLIDLHDSAQGFDLLTAGFAQPLQDKPRRFLSDVDFLAQLQTADALACCHE